MLAALYQTKLKTLTTCIVLFLLVVAVYWQIGEHQFINFDDPAYITDNHQVAQGLTKSGVIWAFTSYHASNWHPVTWLSHMLDYQLFGLQAGRHHHWGVLCHCSRLYQDGPGRVGEGPEE